jgi:hypothetical protein
MSRSRQISCRSAFSPRTFIAHGVGAQQALIVNY